MAKRGIGKQILGTVLAVLSGWLAAMIVLETTTVIKLLRQPHYIVPEALLVATHAVDAAYFALHTARAM
jgi:hypothetical protein